MNWLNPVTLLPCLLLAACGLGSEPQHSSPYTLATWTENRVSGEIRLTWGESGQAQLEAIFTPEEGCHLYSKDLPMQGADGLGRPTLFEILPDSLLIPVGELTTSVASIPDEDIPGLFIYPVGSVTLTLPITLPEGEGWFDDLVIITYMACRDGKCYPPVEGKIIPISIPGLAEIRGK
jgi:hypothetical protein